jgi:hypothetical protein
MTALHILAMAHTLRNKSRVLAGLRGLCFWGSVVLPMSYLPILYGTDGPTQLHLLGALIAVHALFLVISRDYSR